MAQETKAAIQVKLLKLTPTATPLSGYLVYHRLLGTILLDEKQLYLLLKTMIDPLLLVL